MSIYNNNKCSISNSKCCNNNSNNQSTEFFKRTKCLRDNSSRFLRRRKVKELPLPAEKRNPKSRNFKRGTLKDNSTANSSRECFEKTRSNCQFRRKSINLQVTLRPTKCWKKTGDWKKRRNLWEEERELIKALKVSNEGN